MDRSGRVTLGAVALLVALGIGYAVFFAIGQSRELRRQGMTITALAEDAQVQTELNRAAIEANRRAFERLEHRMFLLARRQAANLSRIATRAGIEIGFEPTELVVRPPFQLPGGGGADGSGDTGGQVPPSPVPSVLPPPTVGQGGSGVCPPHNPKC